MIDPRIPLMGQQQQDTFGNLAQGVQMGQGLRQLLSGRQVGKMAALAPEERQAFANNSMFSRELNGQIKADQAAQFAQALALQKHNADIGKTQSEAFKNNTQGQGYGLDNSGKKLGAIQGAFQQASLTGDKTQVLLGMNALVRTGMMSAEDYQQQSAIVNAMNPDELKQYAGGINFANAKDPAALQYQSADNSADNAQSDKNSIRTTQASIYSTDKTAQTAANKLAQDGQQFNQNFEYTAQQDEIKNNQGEIKEFGGKAYIVYKDGTYRPAVGVDGQQIIATKSETPVQKMERQEKIQSFADSAASAANATKMAAELANDLKGLNGAAGGFTPFSMLQRNIPGTDAYKFVQKLETLKANVFLQQISQMRGLGALTDAEGARLEKSVASLNPDVGAEQLQKNITEIAQTLARAGQSAAQKASIYSGGAGQKTTKQQAPQNNVLGFFD